MHVQSCCFANLNQLLFCRSCWLRCRCCLSFLIHKNKGKTLDTPGIQTLWTWWTLICNNIENDHCFYYMTYISTNPWSARSLGNWPVEISVTNLIFFTLFRTSNLTLMYIVYNFEWYRSFRSEVAQGWSYPSVQGFCCNLAGIAFWLWKINNNLICLQALIAIQENTVIHFQIYICRIALFTLLTCCCVWFSIKSFIWYLRSSLKIQASGVRHNDDFLLNTLKILRLSILSGAIKFVSVRLSYGNLSLFEIIRASVLFSRKF